MYLFQMSNLQMTNAPRLYGPVVFVIFVAVTTQVFPGMSTAVSEDAEDAARLWIDGELSVQMQRNFMAYMRSLWNYSVNMTKENSIALVSKTKHRMLRTPTTMKQTMWRVNCESVRAQTEAFIQN